MLALVPMILIPSFKRLSWLNLVGCLSTVLVTLVLLLSVLMDVDRSRMPLQVLRKRSLLMLQVDEFHHAFQASPVADSG